MGRRRRRRRKTGKGEGEGCWFTDGGKESGKEDSNSNLEQDNFWGRRLIIILIPVKDKRVKEKGQR
jgi:hypothetical protein